MGEFFNNQESSSLLIIGSIPPLTGVWLPFGGVSAGSFSRKAAGKRAYGSHFLHSRGFDLRVL